MKNDTISFVDLERASNVPRLCIKMNAQLLFDMLKKNEIMNVNIQPVLEINMLVK